MPPSYRKVKVDFGKELVEESGEGDEKKDERYAHHVKTDQDVLQGVDLVQCCHKLFDLNSWDQIGVFDISLVFVQ